MLRVNLVKRATSLFNSFRRNAARQVAFIRLNAAFIKFSAFIQGQVPPYNDLKLHFLNH